MHHKHLFPSIAVCFNSDSLLGSLEYAAAAAREASGEKCPDACLAGVFITAPTVGGNDEGS